MPYPRRLLKDGEEVALDLRPHWWYFSKHILTAIPLLFLLWVSYEIRNTITWWIWIVIALAWAAWLVVKYFDWNFTHFVVTTDRVIFRTGVLSKHGVEIPLDRISNINFNQGIWERIIGAGDIRIESAGRDGQSRFDDVWHPDGVQQEIYRMMDEYGQRRLGHHPRNGPAPEGGLPAVTTSAGSAAAATAAADARANVPEQIQQLADLRDKGLISAQEYETKKAELLDRM